MSTLCESTPCSVSSCHFRYDPREPRYATHPRCEEFYEGGFSSSDEFVKVVTVEVDDLARGDREGEGDER